MKGSCANVITPIQDCSCWWPCFLYCHITSTVNTLGPRQNGRHFPDDIFKWIFLIENVWISINISLKFVPRGPINNIPTLVQVMAWRRSGDKPLSEPMMVRLPTHICVTRPQWVNIAYVRLVGLNVLQGKIFLPVMYVEISFRYPNNYNQPWKMYMLSYKPANPFANCYNPPPPPPPQHMNNKTASMFLCLQFQRTIISFSSLSFTFSMSAKFSSIANFLLGSDEYLVVLDVKL